MTTPRILMVDDELELISATAERLALRGFEVETATSGREALRRIVESTFSILLVDVKMPGMSGLDVLEEVKRSQPDLPVVLFTGHGSLAAAEMGLKHGAVDYILKPVNIDSMIETINKAISGKGSEES